MNVCLIVPQGLGNIEVAFEDEWVEIISFFFVNE